MIRSDDPNIEGYEYRYKVIEVLGVRPKIEMADGHVLTEDVFKGPDTREFRTLAGANKYADKLMRRGRGWPVIVQVGKLLWLTAAGNDAEIAALGGEGPEEPTGGPATQSVHA